MTLIRRLLAFTIGFVLGGAWSAAHASDLAPPTAFEVYPYLAGVCLNNGPASSYGATGVEGSQLTGGASIQGFVCKLKVHTGRGGGIRIFSACADVVWNMDGSVASVTPTQSNTNYTIVCQ